jgi:hypothetical protein
MLADPDFRHLRDSIARALRHVPHLSAEDVEELARTYLPRGTHDEEPSLLPQ